VTTASMTADQLAVADRLARMPDGPLTVPSRTGCKGTGTLRLPALSLR
jgi:hypothetical protein